MCFCKPRRCFLCYRLRSALESERLAARQLEATLRWTTRWTQPAYLRTANLVVGEHTVADSVEIPEIALSCTREEFLCGGVGAAAEAADAKGGETVATDAECLVCMDAGRNVCLQPCGHRIMCAGCARRVFVCPLCRAAIELLEVYSFLLAAPDAADVKASSSALGSESETASEGPCEDSDASSRVFSSSDGAAGSSGAEPAEPPIDARL
eukprot:c9488_g1_i1.p3 GENE.c9488_g1_i1~~c9488_g1_i1.p3  ORF type:complete len:210 (+),score=23.82 c9488_g1_i1:788-1417(+)